MSRSHAFSEVVAGDAATVPITHPQRILFPEDGITKSDLVHYYRNVAHWLLPYLADRPLTLQCWPDGIAGPSFFETELARGAPEWIKTTSQPAGDRGVHVEHPLCNDAPSLSWFANLSSITMHVAMSRVASFDTPELLLFELEPFDDCRIKTLARVALLVRDELATLGLTPLVKTTGGKGLHIVVPLQARYSYGHGRALNELLAQRVKRLLPDAVTLERVKSKRPRGTVFFDWTQLGKGKTYVPPFVVRAHKCAPVSMPLEWTDVEVLWGTQSDRPTHDELARWNLRTVPTLLAEKGDVWRKPFARGQRLESALARARVLWRTARG